MVSSGSKASDIGKIQILGYEESPAALRSVPDIRIRMAGQCFEAYVVGVVI